MHRIRLLLTLCAVLLPFSAQAEKLTIAAAADLKFAMEDLAATYRHAHPGDVLEVIYGSSGKFHSQIRQGAPYDIFFSADIALPRELVSAGLAASAVKPYAHGRIVLWSASLDAGRMTLASLAEPRITRVAIANPRHAPYGKRAVEALKAAGVWEHVEPKLVYGENIAQTAQFVQSGNAQVGVIALSLAVAPELAGQGGYWLIPDTLHQPLEQGFVITRRSEGNAASRRFADYMASAPARKTMAKYGFALPGEPAVTH